ncbi:SRF-TF domain-containing protein, partial [Cephalotus follicularis]
DARQNAISKRRFGVFKKAKELCTLFSAETVLVISPGCKAFTFGHPGVDATIRRLDNGEMPYSLVIQSCQDDHAANLRKLKMQHAELLEQIEAEKKRAQKLRQINSGKCWLNTPIDKLNLKELEVMQAMLENFEERLLKHIDKVSSSTSTSATNFAGAI